MDPLAPLRARFLARATEDLAALKRGDTDRETLKYLVHRLAGSAGMFGYHEVSGLAAVVDDQLHEGQAAQEKDLAALVAALETLPEPSPPA